MIGFRDGPAAGVALALRRAPLYLRVVIDAEGGKVDALDRLEDTPAPSERVHVYRRVSYTGSVHVCYRGKQRHLSGWYPSAEYEHVPGVDGERLRGTEAWQQWAHAQAEARPKAEVL